MRGLVAVFSFLVVSFLCLNLSVSAQAPAPYETISIAQGLSQGMVFDLLQDQQGFIWVGTKNGLNRYDGYSFTVFNNDPYNANSLSSNTISKIFEDSRGFIWVGTEDAGINVYDKFSNRFIRIQYNAADAQSLSGNAIRAIDELPDGRMIIATDGGGFNLVKINNDFFTGSKIPQITRLSLPDGVQVYGMGVDSLRRVWIGGMDKSVYQFDFIANKLSKTPGAELWNNGNRTRDNYYFVSSRFLLFYNKNLIPLFNTKKITAGNLAMQPASTLWENLHRDPFFYNITEWPARYPISFNIKPANEIQFFYPFIIDQSGILWSGSVGYGLRKFNVTGNKFRSQIPGYSVRGLIVLDSTSLLVGNYSYDWSKLKGDSLEPSPLIKFPNIRQVDNILVARNGDYWISSDEFGYYHYKKNSNELIAYKGINPYQGIGDKSPLLEDRKGNAWLSGRGGHFILINGNNGSIDSLSISPFAHNEISAKSACTALYEDKSGTVWIATREGFAKVTAAGGIINKKEIKWYSNKPNDRNSLNYNQVSCFLDDPVKPNDYLWICTKGGGLNRLEKKTGNFIHITSKEGLPHDVVYGILADKENNIWGSTNNGIFCLLNPSGTEPNWQFRNFSKAYGLQDDEFNTAAYVKLPNGNLAFGGVNGLNIFDPKDVLKEGFTPSVFITSILINNNSIEPYDESGILNSRIEQTKKITLSYQQNIVTFEFSSLDFTSPDQNRYRYQMIGIDKDWVQSGTRRSATYVHMPTGSYTFRVQGSNSQGIWSEKITELNIKVLPPWWRTWWAYIIYGLLFFIAVRIFYRITLNRSRLRAQLNSEQEEARRMKELDMMKTRLYTNITHEFRTPLTVILGTARQVKEKLGEEYSSSMNMIVRNGQSLLKLVNELLDLSKLETGNMSLQTVHGDVINYLRYISESFQPLAETQRIGLHFLSDIDRLITSYDPEKIRQIIANLISNAIKFTGEKGHIYISVHKIDSEEDEDKLTLYIKVKDTGIGIPEGELKNIFNRFYQLDNSITRQTGGTGIGLSLTRELVKLMNGEIVVKSPPTGANKGTEFTVSLPMKKVEFEEPIQSQISSIIEPLTDPKILNRENEEALAGNSRPLILLVEDNADVVAYIASCLDEYRLAVGKDGKEGLEIAKNLVPDLVITDVMMPYMDGFELTRHLKSDEQTSHIPVVMLTAKTDMESKITGIQQGADAYLEKPFHREELLLRIQKLLELRISLRSYYQRQAGVSAATETTAEEESLIVHNENLEDQFVKKVREIIEDNLSDSEFSVEQLCKKVFMSHSQLHRKLDALTGQSPNKFIRMIRLNIAKRMLKETEQNISSIAMECGYSDPGYFGRVFKQEYGMTPQEWRSEKQK